MGSPQNWRTPPSLFRGLDVFAEVLYGRRFSFDLASDRKNALCFWRVDDAFALPWGWLVAEGHVAWCNPPWDSVGPWVERALGTPGFQGAFLLPARMDRAWFRALCAGALIEGFTGRVAYDDPLSRGRTAPREGSIVAWFGLGRVGVASGAWRDPVTGLYSEGTVLSSAEAQDR